MPGAAPLEALSSGEPRETVGTLVSEFARLRAEAEALKAHFPVRQRQRGLDHEAGEHRS